MKRIITSLITVSSLWASIVCAMPSSYVSQNSWNGFYLGLNAGYWWSANNNISTSAAIDSINPIDIVGASAVADALVIVGNNNSDQHLNGFIGGAQAGYNFLMNCYLLGLELTFDGLTNPNSNDSVSKTVDLVGFPELYDSTFTVKRKIDYLGTVRGRLGYLVTPELMIFGTGGFAYGHVTFNEWITADESLSSFIYPTVVGGFNHSKTLYGWTVGAGAEWMFMPQWSAKLEYAYYDLGKKHDSFTLKQINNLEIPSVVWASVNVSSSTKFRTNSVTFGVNYHFC